MDLSKRGSGVDLGGIRKATPEDNGRRHNRVSIRTGGDRTGCNKWRQNRVSIRTERERRPGTISICVASE